MNTWLDFKNKVDEWLESDRSNIEAGATLLLQLNRNKILYTNIIKRSNVDKLVYELTKQSEILAEKAKITDYKNLTNEEIKGFEEKQARIEKEVLPIVNSNSKGLRVDHDKLPQAAKDAYEANQAIYPKIRSLHEKLKLMVDDRPCDRYPFIKELTEFGDAISANWRLYDEAVVIDLPANPPLDPASKTDTAPPVVPALTAKRVSSNRKYLSDNKKKIPSITDQAKKDELLSKMQERLDELITDGQSVDENQLKELQELGLTIQPINPAASGENK